MPHDGTAEAPSKFRAIAFITEELGKFSPLFLGGFTHAWGVKDMSMWSLDQKVWQLHIGAP